jgi:hypothetical protein
MEMIIIGAGMAGLLAARMLAHHKPVVWEAQSSLPNNHSAVLRFRTSTVGDVLGIPFKPVSMIKDIVPWTNPVGDSIAYSFKNTGQYRSDRSITRGMVSEPRWIAPPDLIERMAEGVNIAYGKRFGNADEVAGQPVISTVPMPWMVDFFGSEVDEFVWASGQSVKAHIKDCDAYVSLLVPNPHEVFTRVSITGHELIVEVPNVSPIDPAKVIERAVWHLGIEASNILWHGPAVKNTYNKIVPINDGKRKSFMYWLTDKHSIYSLGRYATWRPGLLLDDLVKDIRLIDGWIRSKSSYDVALHRR